MTPHDSATPPSRRSFLASTAVAAAAVAGGVPLLTSCGSSDSGGKKEGTTSGKDAQQVLPAFVAANALTPDIPSQNGSATGYTQPIDTAALKTSVPQKLGKGGKLTIMSPLWGTPPPNDNPYYTAMNEAIGTNTTWQNQDGNVYADKLGAVLASSKIPDIVVIPGWNMLGQIPSAIINKFADLGPYLSGDKVKKYPNLAAVPTDAWQRGIFGGKLRGIPFPASYVTNIVPFYRKDVFDAKGYTLPKTAQEFLDFAKEITSAKAKVWACDDMAWTSYNVFGVLSGGEKPLFWNMVDGKMVNRIETPEYLEALEWQRKLYAAGVVHPDAKAQQGDAGNRFTAGQVLMFNNDFSHWYAKTSEQHAKNPDFAIDGMDIFAHDGGTPVIYATQPANIFAFVNKSASKAVVEEALAVSNFTAAPYGTKEYMLTLYGVEGTHYNIQDGLPVKTDAGNTEVNAAWVFLGQPAPVIAHPDFPDITKAQVEWQQRMGAFTKKSSFYGLQVVEPAKWANLFNDLENLEKQIARGQKKISDMQQFISDWQSGGGAGLRDWYKKLLDTQGSGN